MLGDVGKAQSALELAMSVSAGTGKDLTAVSMALAKGYSGQTTALSRLGALGGKAKVLQTPALAKVVASVVRRVVIAVGISRPLRLVPYTGREGHAHGQ